MSGGSVDSYSESLDVPRSPFSLRHVPLIFTTPGAVFSRVEDTGAYAWALVLLLLAIAGLGYLQVQSGLIDRLAHEQTARQMAQLEEEQLNLVDRRRFNDAMERLRDAGEFNIRLRRLHAVALAPLSWLVSMLLIAAVLYAVVALCGRKPEYHTLMSIVALSAYIPLVGLGLHVAMMIFYRTHEVDTSFSMILDPRSYPTATAVLTATDPFRVWFWILVGMGLVTTRQLSVRMAVLACVLMCLCGMTFDAGIAFAKMEMGM